MPDPTPLATVQPPTPTASPVDDGTYQSFLHILFTEYFNAHYVTHEMPDFMHKFADSDSTYVFLTCLDNIIDHAKRSRGRYHAYNSIEVGTEIRSETIMKDDVICQVYVMVEVVNDTAGSGHVYDVELMKTEDSYIVTKIASDTPEYDALTANLLDYRYGEDTSYQSILEDLFLCYYTGLHITYEIPHFEHRFVKNNSTAIYLQWVKDTIDEAYINRPGKEIYNLIDVDVALHDVIESDNSVTCVVSLHVTDQNATVDYYVDYDVTMVKVDKRYKITDILCHDPTYATYLA